MTQVQAQAINVMKEAHGLAKSWGSENGAYAARLKEAIKTVWAMIKEAAKYDEALQVVTGAVKMAFSTKKYVAIKNIVINYAESNIFRDGEIFTNIEKVESKLEKIAQEEVNKIGYCKVGFTVNWEDKESYSGRIDINKNDIGKYNLLKNHIMDNSKFYSGIKPSNMSQSDFDIYMDLHKTSGKEYKFLTDIVNGKYEL